MTTTFGFLHNVIDSLSEHIAVIDINGTIVFVNKAWIKFGQQNGWPEESDWIGVNYAKVCEASGEAGEPYGRQAAEAIWDVFSGKRPDFYVEYPCHSPNELRWFMMRVSRFSHDGRLYCVIAHQNITERRIAEDKVLSLSRLDALTGLSNRRHFDDFLRDEWRRCLRLRQPVTLAMIDIDHFKALNDCYGHLIGDQCLVNICNEIKKIAKRPSDLAARFGGEEFILVFGQSDLEQVCALIQQLLEQIRALRIPNASSPVHPFVTCSAGIAQAYPHTECNEMALIDQADKALYIAKSSGRDQLHCAQLHVADALRKAMDSPQWVSG